ncbi:hypothetical protein PAXRUDRAFT_502664 [Paxillus rubicundulus Ve08.2h10]|uniref:N-acetyltransferase domain-containing protein n=1 Tax=Paxillus rubicundulus Ve08.2h10 TaxID=930991 RepID=A0A0D0DVN7_9AGAM|nr:hypothetical protein PAXRUDRAFT_502664 [Paxillus rubicundulus Ve08.2h10]
MISARFRKFACHPDFQNRGIGTKLLDHTVSHCQSMDAKVLWCDARLSSSQWYQKRGLVSFGDTFSKEFCGIYPREGGPLEHRSELVAAVRAD